LKNTLNTWRSLKLSAAPSRQSTQTKATRASISLTGRAFDTNLKATIKKIPPMQIIQNKIEKIQSSPGATHLPALLQSLTLKGIEASRSDIAAVESGMRLPIRDLGANEAQISVLAAIQTAAQAFTGANVDDMPAQTWKACVELVTTQFAHLGIGEINAAFQHAAAGKIDADLRAFRGVFTAGMLGDVLKKWAEYRQQIQAAIINARHEAAEAEKEAVRQARARLDDKLVMERLESLMRQNEDVESWKDVHAWWFDKLDNAGHIPKENRGPHWKAAKREAVLEFKRCKGVGLFLAKEQAKRILKSLHAEPDIFPPDLQDRAEVIYKKMLVHSVLAKYKP
jgi:hypothetical protein